MEREWLLSHALNSESQDHFLMTRKNPPGFLLLRPPFWSSSQTVQKRGVLFAIGLILSVPIFILFSGGGAGRWGKYTLS